MKININKSLPANWDDVTFAHSLKLMKCKDVADTLGVFLNVSGDTLRHGTISNLNDALDRIRFLDTSPMPEQIPKSINGYLLSKNLEFNSICRYEDLKSLVQKVILKKEGDTLTPEQLETYAGMVGIYAMPNYENADPQERDAFAKQFLNSPCGEVMAIGNFTLRKFLGLKTPGQTTFQKLLTLIHRLRLVSSGYRARLGFSLRFYLWKRKHHISDMKSLIGR